ncbi:MAG: hypothetical protein ACK5RK_04120 [Betaproteobacteria bacterium]
MQRQSLATAALALAAALATTPARAELSAEELAKLAQNPIANLVSFPLQSNTNFNTGPLAGGQNALNIQPLNAPIGGHQKLVRLNNDVNRLSLPQMQVTLPK